MLKEGAAIQLVEMKIPEVSPEQRRKGILLALSDAAKNGVTSVQDYADWDDFGTYRQIKDDGNLAVRITEWLNFTLPLNDRLTMRREDARTHPTLTTGAPK